MFGSSAQPETLTSCVSWVDTPSPSSAAPAASAPPADKNAGGKFEQRLMSNLQRLYITRISASLLLSNFTCAYAACLALLTPPGFPIDTRLTEPELTPDPAMPSLLRDATHDFCDAVWKELYAELQAYFSDQDRQDAPAKTSAPPADPPPSPPSDESWDIHAQQAAARPSAGTDRTSFDSNNNSELQRGAVRTPRRSTTRGPRLRLKGFGCWLWCCW